MRDILNIAGREIRSRLFIGTGKFRSPEIMRDAVRESNAEIVTVALRRVDFDPVGPNLLEYLDRDDILILPNTSGAANAEEAVRLARLARARRASSLGKARGHAGAEVASSRSGGNAPRDRDLGEGRVRGAAVHRR